MNAVARRFDGLDQATQHSLRAGDSPKKLAKAAGVPADAYIIDWEDAVAEDRKDAARAATIDAMPSLLAQGRYVLVRRNLAPGEFGEADAEALRKCVPQGVVVPKCDDVADVEQTLAELPDSVMVYAMIESPQGLHNAYSIAVCSTRVAGLMFGAEDYSARVGIIRTAGEPELPTHGPRRERGESSGPRGIRFHRPCSTGIWPQSGRLLSGRASRLHRKGGDSSQSDRCHQRIVLAFGQGNRRGACRPEPVRVPRTRSCGIRSSLEDKPAVVDALSRINAKRRYEK